MAKNQKKQSSSEEKLSPTVQGPKLPAGKTIAFIEGLGGWFNQLTKRSLLDFVDLETADSAYTLVSKQGSLLSVIQLSGTTEQVGGEEFMDFMRQLYMLLTPAMRNPGTVLDMFFSVDPEGAIQEIQQNNSKIRETARQLKLEVTSILDSREQHLPKFVSKEECYLAIWTNKNGLFERSDSLKEIYANTPRTPITKQPLLATEPTLREQHDAVISALLDGLKPLGLLGHRLTAKETLHIARRHMNPKSTGSEWKPVLPGDKVPITLYRDNGRAYMDVSDVMYPSLPLQLCANPYERLNDKMAESDGVYYGAMQIEIPPQTILPFSELFKKLGNAGIPYRINFNIEGGGMRFIKLKKSLSALLVWAKGRNRNIQQAVKAMEEVSQTEATVRFRVVACTWADSEKELRSRQNQMAQILASWGDCQVRFSRGDPLEFITDSLPFIKEKKVSNPCIAPLLDLVRMLPVLRPASPWSHGTILFRSEDGRIIPFMPGSSLQSTWSYIMVAPPGGGKSVLLSSILLGSTLEPGLTRLPRIALMDIGPSAKGIITVLRDCLPREERHLAAHFELRMTPEYSINPFDLQLGCRFPTPEHLQFLVNFVTLLATPPGGKPFESLSRLVTLVINEMYKQKADLPESRPNQYSAALNPEVDAKLAEYPEFDLFRKSWWQITDFLFQKGHYHHATLAQRYAVPRLEDAISCVKIAHIRDTYTAVIVETGESLEAAFTRQLKEASSAFPILNEPTQFDIGDVRIAAIDLMEVAKKGSPVADHQTAVVYMLAKYVLTKDFYLRKETLSGMPEMVRDYHKQRISEIYEDKKWVVWDEYHRTAKADSVREEAITDQKEGRKFNLGCIFLSQNASDFPQEMVDLATGRFFLKSSDRAAAERLREQFGFNLTTKEAFLAHCHGPTEKGAPFVATLLTKDGIFTQLLYSTISPVEMWAFSTTVEDVRVRELVTAELGTKEARARLGRAYPQSAKRTIEGLRNQAAQKGFDAEFDPIKVVAKEIIASSPIYERVNEGAIPDSAWRQESILSGTGEAD